jgi:uncharacterized protein (DUF111 family)
MQETGTLGVRVYLCERHVVNRDVFAVDVLVEGVKESIRVKVAKSVNGEILSIKPEFEDLKNLARMTKKPLREVSDIVLVRAREEFQKKGTL